MILQAVYEAIQPSFQNEGLLTFSGLQEKVRIPFVLLSKITSNLDTRDTCGNRYEKHLVQISLVHNYFKDFKDDLDTIRNLLLYKTLNITNRTTIGIDEVQLLINEPEKGIYQGIYIYEILTSKALSLFEQEIINSSDLFSGLFSRYKNTNLSAKTNGFVTTRYGEFKRPFLTIPEYSQFLDGNTTKTRIDAFNFDINLEAHDFDDLETLTEDLDNLFSYTRFKLNDKKFLVIDWLGNEYMEEEVGLWVSKTHYQCLLESNIG